jgi:hypothetical protein
MRRYYYHGTSPAMYNAIRLAGKLTAPVYVAAERRLALTFSKNRLRFHPDREKRKERVVLKLDLKGFRLTPDPDPEAQHGRYKGKLFISGRSVPTSRIVSVLRR